MTMNLRNLVAKEGMTNADGEILLLEVRLNKENQIVVLVGDHLPVHLYPDVVESIIDCLTQTARLKPPSGGQPS